MPWVYQRTTATRNEQKRPSYGQHGVNSFNHCCHARARVVWFGRNGARVECFGKNGITAPQLLFAQLIAPITAKQLLMR